MKWIGRPVAQIWPFEIVQDARSVVGRSSMYDCNSKSGIVVDHGELDRSVAKWLRQQPIAGNDNVAAKTENIYLWNCDRQDQNSNGKSGVFDHNELEETDPKRLRKRPIILPFWAVRHCRNHLATLLSSSSRSKIPNFIIRWIYSFSQW